MEKREIGLFDRDFTRDGKEVKGSRVDSSSSIEF